METGGASKSKTDDDIASLKEDDSGSWSYCISSGLLSCEFPDDKDDRGDAREITRHGTLSSLAWSQLQ